MSLREIPGRPPRFATSANFAHSRHRGFRVPNRYSAKDPEELKTLGVRERIVVSNARHLAPAPTLDSHGFELVVAPTALDLMDTDVVRGSFYEECRALLARVTGCDEVRGGAHEYRNGFGGQSGPRGVRPTPNGSGGAYAQGIHADMCAAVEDRFLTLIPDARHFESINIWRSANRETVRMMPLAVCDMRSVRPDDIVFGDGQNTGNIEQYTKVVDQRLIHGPHQRWYYCGGSELAARCAHALHHRGAHAGHLRQGDRQGRARGPFQGADSGRLRGRASLRLVERTDRGLRAAGTLIDVGFGRRSFYGR